LEGCKASKYGLGYANQHRQQSTPNCYEIQPESTRDRIARSTPPPMVSLSVRHIEKPVGRISLSDMVECNQSNYIIVRT